MQLTGEAVAFFDDGEFAAALVESRVLDGDGRVHGEHFDGGLIVGGELGGTVFVR